MKKNAEAIEIFKLNLEMFSQSANVYDSLAEAYMAQNDKELSIANYKKSLELDPNNANARSRLARLTNEQKDFKVDPKIYDSYVGEYQLGPTFTITITSEDGKLMAQATGQDKFELFATSETDFYLKAVPASVTFVKDGEGKVTELILTQNGRKVTVKKIR
jgi:tetratricopeptide (TPR) repeat protein